MGVRCGQKNPSEVRGSLFGITRLCRVMPNSDPKGQIFLSAQNNHDKFFFLHTFWSLAFDFNVGVAINELRSYMLTSALLKIDVTMTSTPTILMTELPGLLYNQCIDDMCCYSFFIYPTRRIRVTKVRFVSTGENCGKPYLVCKKKWSKCYGEYPDNTMLNVISIDSTLCKLCQPA